MNKTAAPSNYALLQYRTVPSSTREETVVANATSKKVNELDAKTFSKCYVGRNGKQNQQKLHIQVHVWIGIKGAMTKCVC